MPGPCEECGSRDVQRKRIHGLLVEECGLCEHLQGDDATVARVLERRAAEQLGVPTALYGLIQALDSVPGLAVDQALSTMAGMEMPPAVFFHLLGTPLEILDRLTRTLTLACRRTANLWTIEVTHQARLLFVLRPRLFHGAGELSPEEEEHLRTDLAILRVGLLRDLQLSWWELSSQ